MLYTERCIMYMYTGWDIEYMYIYIEYCVYSRGILAKSEKRVSAKIK